MAPSPLQMNVEAAWPEQLSVGRPDSMLAALLVDSLAHSLDGVSAKQLMTNLTA